MLSLILVELATGIFESLESLESLESGDSNKSGDSLGHFYVEEDKFKQKNRPGIQVLIFTLSRLITQLLLLSIFAKAIGE